MYDQTNLADKLVSLENIQGEKVKEGEGMQGEINSLKKMADEIEEENRALSQSLKLLEQNVANQEAIYNDYNDKTKIKKSEYSQFMEKLEVQENLHQKKIGQLSKELETLHEVQEELSFLFNVSSKKMTSNSQFLDFVKGFEGTNTVKYLRERLNLDSSKNRPKPQVVKKEQNVLESNQEGETLNLKAFKDIIRGVLKKE